MSNFPIPANFFQLFQIVFAIPAKLFICHCLRLKKPGRFAAAKCTFSRLADLISFASTSHGRWEMRERAKWIREGREGMKRIGIGSNLQMQFHEHWSEMEKMFKGKSMPFYSHLENVEYSTSISGRAIRIPSTEYTKYWLYFILKDSRSNEIRWMAMTN